MLPELLPSSAQLSCGILMLCSLLHNFCLQFTNLAYICTRNIADNSPSTPIIYVSLPDSPTNRPTSEGLDHLLSPLLLHLSLATSKKQFTIQRLNLGSQFGFGFKLGLLQVALDGLQVGQEYILLFLLTQHTLVLLSCSALSLGQNLLLLCSTLQGKLQWDAAYQQ